MIEQHDFEQKIVAMILFGVELIVALEATDDVISLLEELCGSQ
ncbi:hypothetical protein [Methylocystis suflitae]|nr:hypothetical protein [Methylocystis suflitae]